MGAVMIKMRLGVIQRTILGKQWLTGTLGALLTEAPGVHVAWPVANSPLLIITLPARASGSTHRDSPHN